MSENSEPTHVLTTDCILPEQGRCEAGKMFCESDVIPSTWSWLLQRGLIRSVEEIEAEADADDGDVNPNAGSTNEPPQTGGDSGSVASQTGGEQSTPLDESSSGESVETGTNEPSETATTEATVEGESAQMTETPEAKPAVKKPRK